MMSSVKYFKLTALLWAVIACAIMPISGCAGWRARQWDISQLRDERAQELDERLSKAPPSVQNPFAGPHEH